MDKLANYRALVKKLLTDYCELMNRSAAPPTLKPKLCLMSNTIIICS